MHHPTGAAGPAVPDAADPPAAAEARRPPWGLVAWAGSLLYFASLFHRRWIPFDEGTLGQAALRILRGEMPHRDFEAMYSGLGDMLHAAVMALLGVNLLTPRVVLLLAVALWIPALWALARRLVGSPGGAAVVVVLAVALGPPNYPAAMPSWYNLFFATWGLLALVRWSEGGGRRWLVAAGACAGISVLFKVVGLYFLAAALFFVLQRTLRERRASSYPLQAASALAVGCLVAMELLLVRSQAGAAAWVSYVLPTAALGAAAVAAAWRTRRTDEAPASHPSDTSDLGLLAGRWAAVVVGTVLPLLPFLAWYAWAGALPDLWHGIVVLPSLRLDRVALPPPPLLQTSGILVPVMLLALEARLPRHARQALAVAVAAMGALLLARMDPPIYRALFSSLLLAVPVSCVAGAVMLARRPALPGADVLAATLWTAALVHLVRFPFAGPIYFTYVAPLAALGAAGALAAWRSGAFHAPPPGDERDGGATSGAMPSEGSARSPLAAFPVALALAGVALAFLLLGPNRGGLFGPLPPAPTAPLPFERGRIDVPVYEAQEYARLAALVDERARGEHILATPDVPEIYFLTGFRNPTRSLFEIFEDEATRVRTTLAALDEHGVSVVVVNTRPRFSSLPPPLAEALRARYPLEARVGRFLVRWRE